MKLGSALGSSRVVNPSTAIAMAVENHPVLKAVQVKLAEISYLVNVLRGATEAFQQRKSMVQQMCQLFITGYFGDVDSVRKREVDEKLAKATKVPDPKRRESQWRERRKRRKIIKEGEEKW